MVVSAIQSSNRWWKVDQTGGMALGGIQEQILIASVISCAKIFYDKTVGSKQHLLTDSTTPSTKEQVSEDNAKAGILG